MGARTVVTDVHVGMLSFAHDTRLERHEVGKEAQIVSFCIGSRSLDGNVLH